MRTVFAVTLFFALSSAIPSHSQREEREFSLEAGMLEFPAAKEGPSGPHRWIQGGIRFDRPIGSRYFLGAMADISLNFCPICDQTPKDALQTLSLVAGPLFRVKPFHFQVGSGIGVAGGIVGSSAGSDRFLSVNIPFFSRAEIRHEFGGFGIGIGLGMKYHLNFRNNAVAVFAPLVLSF